MVQGLGLKFRVYGPLKGTIRDDVGIRRDA